MAVESAVGPALGVDLHASGAVVPGPGDASNAPAAGPLEAVGVGGDHAVSVAEDVAGIAAGAPAPVVPVLAERVDIDANTLRVFDGPERTSLAGPVRVVDLAERVVDCLGNAVVAIDDVTGEAGHAVKGEISGPHAALRVSLNADAVVESEAVDAAEADVADPGGAGGIGGRIVGNALSPALVVDVAGLALAASSEDVIEGFAVGVDELAVAVKVEVVSGVAGETVGAKEYKGAILEDIHRWVDGAGAIGLQSVSHVAGRTDASVGVKSLAVAVRTGHAGFVDNQEAKLALRTFISRKRDVAVWARHQRPRRVNA